MDLIQRLQEAAEGSRELDLEIGEAVAVVRFNPATGRYRTDRLNKETLVHNAPRYTTSIDAALTLVPEHFRWSVNARQNAVDRVDGYLAHVWFGTTPSYESTETWAATPALALCIAALKARTQEGLSELTAQETDNLR